MKRLLSGAIAGIAMLLAGCSIPTRYHALDQDGGYQEFAVDDDEFVIEFRGNEFTDAAIVRDFALYRAAEFARSGGFDAFEVVGTADAPYTPIQPEAVLAPPPKPTPGYILQIRCAKNLTPSDKVYQVSEVITRLGPKVQKS